jgi:hypothetical protein
MTIREESSNGLKEIASEPWNYMRAPRNDDQGRSAMELHEAPRHDDYGGSDDRSEVVSCYSKAVQIIIQILPLRIHRIN